MDRSDSKPAPGASTRTAPATQRLGVVTGGGDCPGLNAVIRAVCKAAAQRGWEALGIVGGFEGLLEPRRTLPLDDAALAGLLVRGGTILGTSNRGRFSMKQGHGGRRELPDELVEGARRGMQSLGLSALVVIGGDGTLTIAQALHERGLPLVGVPKTIDNDVPGTLWTFGFDSAVACATDALDRLHTTAESHERVIVLEVMGRYAGWIALFAGIAGGADVVLIPEIPFRHEAIGACIRAREARGCRSSLIVAAEGARENGGGYVTASDQPAAGEARLGGIGERVAAEVARRTGKESRHVVLGHLQRGGSPTPFDRALCSLFGATAVEMVAAGEFGRMVAFIGPHVGSVTLQEATAQLKTVPRDSGLARTALALGISFGE